MKESVLQFDCVMWFNKTYRNIAHLVHVPNAREQDAKKGAWWRGQGVVAGWPDLMVVQGGRVLLIELKTKDGRVSPVQKELHKSLNDKGTVVHVVRDLATFQEVVNGFLGVRVDGAKNDQKNL